MLARVSGDLKSKCAEASRSQQMSRMSALVLLSSTHMQYGDNKSSKVSE